MHSYWLGGKASGEYLPNFVSLCLAQASSIWHTNFLGAWFIEFIEFCVSEKSFTSENVYNNAP